MVRLRFAPSPTGNLHVGGLRTALFCWLYARQRNGKFILRLEDTDQKRLVKDSENDLISMLEWSGISIDESPFDGGDFAPYRQSERLNIYNHHVQGLIHKNLAYRCFCSEERINSLRNEQRLKGKTPRYDRLCRKISNKESRKKVESGEDFVIRMKIPEESECLILDDIIRGRISIDTSNSEDQVIMKSDGFPTYHFAVVVDDHLMKITHVVRGEEWLPSFPKHLLLYRYFGWDPPKFAHLPLILNPDRSKLSKRQMDVSVEDFRDQGYLPEALINFVSLLGWSPLEEREIFSLSELVKEFSFKRINKSGAIFDREKLNWMNHKYIQNLDQKDLIRRLRLFLESKSFKNLNPDFVKKIIQIQQARLVTLKDFFEKLPFFLDDNPETNNSQVLSLLKEKSSKLVLEEFHKQLSSIEILSKENLQIIVKNIQKKTNLKGANLWLPLRYAITLEVKGPDLNLIVDLFGKEKCLRLIERAIEI